MQNFYHPLKPMIPVLFLGLLSACQNQGLTGDAVPSTSQQAEQHDSQNFNIEAGLAGSGRWTPEPIFGSAASPPHIVFEKNKKGTTKIRGMAGCNRLFGAYIQDGTALSFGPMATTKMACTYLDDETQFLAKLSAVRSFALHGQYLVLFESPDHTGQPILYLQHTQSLN